MAEYVQVPGQGWFPTSGHQHAMGSSLGLMGAIQGGHSFSHSSPQPRLPGYVHGPENAVSQQYQQHQLQQNWPQQYQAGNAFKAPTPQNSVAPTLSYPYRPGASSSTSNYGAPNADNIRFCDLMYGWGNKWNLPPHIAAYIDGGYNGPVPDLTAFNAQRDANIAAVDYPLSNPSVADPASILSQLRYDGYNILDTPWTQATAAPLPCPEPLLPAPASYPMDIYQPGLQGVIGQGRAF
jgi:hypothetical protein